MIQKLATIDDLYHAEGKAELVDGVIQYRAPTGVGPGYAGDEAYASLRAYAKKHLVGLAFADGKGFLCNLPHRQSFSPDAAYYSGPLPAGLKYAPQAPDFAIEVRSEGDYSPAAEIAMASKRQDYFAAGTLVVWDVDLESPIVVRVYRATSPNEPTIYRRGELAEAEPAVPGWQMPVDDLFPPARK